MRSLLFLLLLPALSFADVRLPGVLADNMVLQRDRPLNIWGRADVGEAVTVTFQNKTCQTTTGTDSTWRVTLKKSKAGGPFTMQITGKNTLTLRNILVGEVWLCSGQSNMEYKSGWAGKVYRNEAKDLPAGPSRNARSPNRPTMLFNAMIASLANYGIRGVIWYKGEANTGMACAIDIGKANDTHPKNKHNVGKRLALNAMRRAYGETKTVFSGPMYESMRVVGDTIRLTFTQIGTVSRCCGSVAKDGPLRQFAIAGADRKFSWANARIVGSEPGRQEVLVWSDTVKTRWRCVMPGQTIPKGATSATPRDCPLRLSERITGTA